MQLELNLSWESLVYNPLLASKLKEAEVIYLYPSTIQQASEGLQEALMQAYVDYISVCFSAEIYNDEHITALGNVKRQTELVYQEVYKINPVHYTADIKLSDVVVSTFTVTHVIDQPTDTFQQVWIARQGYQQKYLEKMFTEGAVLTINPNFIYKVKELAGHDGYLYQHVYGDKVYWAILVTDELIW